MLRWNYWGSVLFSIPYSSGNSIRSLSTWFDILDTFPLKSKERISKGQKNWKEKFQIENISFRLRRHVKRNLNCCPLDWTIWIWFQKKLVRPSTMHHDAHRRAMNWNRHKSKIKPTATRMDHDHRYNYLFSWTEPTIQVLVIFFVE